MPTSARSAPRDMTTPNLDRMAAEGMKFTSFYSAQARLLGQPCGAADRLLSQSRRHSGALGPHSKVGISDKEMTIAQLCKQKGYATAIFGKWHLGDAPQFLPMRHGFDEYFGLPYSNDMTPHGLGDNAPDTSRCRSSTRRRWSIPTWTMPRRTS